MSFWRMPTILLTTGLIVAGCAPADDAPADSTADADPAAATEAPVGASLPELITINDAGLHPEGIEWDAEHGRFLLSSVTRGTVTAVDDAGTHSVLVDDPDNTASIGIHIDAGRGRVYVASSDLAVFEDPEYPGQARLGAYDLATGERIFLTDLGPVGPGERHFANDITVGADGMVYVTNSMQPLIYAVTPDGTASVFVESDLLAPTGIGLNGIEAHPDGYLLVAHMGNSQLLRVPLDGSDEIHVVEIAEAISGDGLVLMRDGGLAVVGSTADVGPEVLVLRSEDGWETAEVAARTSATANATTGALRDGEIYYVDARFDDMLGETPAETFDIRRVDFR